MNKLLKTTFFLLLGIFEANSSFSQSLVWEKLIGNLNQEERCNASMALGKSRYLFGGYRGIYNPQISTTINYPLLIFTNTQGDTIMTKCYYQFYGGRILALTSDLDSTIIAAGYSASNTNPNQGAVFVFKADYYGNIIWQKYFKQGQIGSRYSLLTVPDGYLLYSERDADLLKLDKEGNLLWQKPTFAAAGSGSISIMKDGSYLASGWSTAKTPSSVPSLFSANPFLAKLKPNGDTIHTKVFGSFTNQDLLYEAKETADGGVIVVGRYVINSAPTKMQGLIMKFDSAWNQQWWYTIMPPHGAYDDGCELFNVQQLADSSYIVSGKYIDTHSSGYGEDNGYVAKIAKDGSGIVWQQQYKANSTEWFTSMFYMNDGSAVFSGYRNLTGGNRDFYLVKLKNLGLPYVPNYCQQKPTPQLSVQVITNDTIAFSSTSLPGTRYGTISTYLWRFGDGTTSTLSNPKHKYNMPLSALQNVPVTLIVNNNSGCTDSITVYPFLRVSAPEAIPGLQVQLYPNPASSKTTFSIAGYTSKEAVMIELLDVLGRKVKVPVKQLVNGEMQQLEVNTSALPAGLYLYRLYSGNQLLGSGKLVKE